MQADRLDRADPPAAPDRRLAAAIVEFNCLPGRYAHDSWFAVLPRGALLLRLRESPRVAQRLSRELLAAWGLEGHYCFDFSAPSARLALLDGSTLAQLVLYAGLTATAAYVRRAVERDKMAALKQRLGEPALLFALKRAPFLSGVAPLPDALHRASPDAFHQITLLAGLQCLAASLKGQERALRRRLLLKFPQGWAAAFAPSKATPPPAACARLFDQLLLEFAPQWAHLAA
ncbi:MAG: SctK family type III secretion system sorting platform protein [Candidatus Competibacter sp.]